jgi:putative hydrolase of the HAD superfamily
MRYSPADMSTSETPTEATHCDQGLDASRVRAITIDLDDTLWPIWPTIARAEGILQDWLEERAPATAALSRDKNTLREVRNQMVTLRPDIAHDMSALRRESIRLLLNQAGEDPALAEPAFDVFFAERHRVELYEDALPALALLASRFPVVAISNGNADVHRTGIGAHFRGALSASRFGVAKPDTRIFHAGADAAGVAPGEVLHIGDDAHLDGVGALNAGMQFAWVRREGQVWGHSPAQPHCTVNDLRHLCAALGI